MSNLKYYQDIKRFPDQFKKIIKNQDNHIQGSFNRIVVCGVGGSSSYVDIIRDYLADIPTLKFRLESNRCYNIPRNANEQTFFIIASHSGNTEEVLNCLKEVDKKNLKFCIFTSGGKLLEIAKKHNYPLYQIPSGIQPRLATGYFLIGVFKILSSLKLISDICEELFSITSKINSTFDEDEAIGLAKKITDKLPIIYSTDNNKSIARISKIKFNENSKIQCFWNYFPEVNHNEMVGFTNLVTKPIFIIFKSKFTYPRNHKRIEVFTRLMEEKNLEVVILDMIGDSNLAEILNMYYFIDHVTYYLAEEYGIDPEPVKMVEKFKKMLN